jgi:hypothetical protein
VGLWEVEGARRKSKKGVDAQGRELDRPWKSLLFVAEERYEMV